MNRKRNVRILEPIRNVSQRQTKVLVALERYGQLDSKHLSLITGLSMDNIAEPLLKLFHSGLVDRPPNNLYRRDRLKDAQVYKRTDLGLDWLERHQIVPHRAILVAAGGSPHHDLAVAQLLACIEAAHLESGLTFYPAGAILSNSPAKTQKLTSPFRFEVGSGHVLPDATFATGYGNDLFCTSFIEVNLSDHGTDKYKKKSAAYHEIISSGQYRTHFDYSLEHKARLLTFDASPTTMATMRSFALKDDPFYFKLIPEYGRFEKAPAPTPAILKDWLRNNGTHWIGGDVSERTRKTG
jgi:hypothetical protein